MSTHVYNAVMVVAWLLVSIGAGMVYLPAGLIVAGLGIVGIMWLTVWLHRAGFRIAPAKPKPATEDAA